MSAPSVIRATFPGSSGDDLAARLELPEGPVRAFALFAHCFSCTKDILAARRIASGLATAGVAVLRFDFTGLGSSEGDFANTDFSSNVEDLIRAANYLRSNYEAPVILIGHSLGGAAVLAAAERIPEAKAVVTISAPADVAHVLGQLGGSLDLIRSEGEAEVTLAGRPFRIRRSFVEDAEMQRLEENIRTLGKAPLRSGFRAASEPNLAPHFAQANCPAPLVSPTVTVFIIAPPTAIMAPKTARPMPPS